MKFLFGRILFVAHLSIGLLAVVGSRGFMVFRVERPVSGFRN
jgi:hypothetical protein